MLIMSDKIYIIAEIGINHEGDFDICTDMIKAAADIGVDAVKLQTINADLNYVVGSESYKVFKGSELTREETASAFSLARENDLDVFTTVGDIETVEWVEKLKPSCWKISSGLLTHIPMVRHLASLGRPLLISTGMASVEDIDLAIKTSQSVGNNNISPVNNDGADVYVIFGMSTPGPLDKRDGAPKSPQGVYGAKDNIHSARLGGTSLVFDDGDDKLLRKSSSIEHDL